jgi:dolichyl-diphosphooligosaccharide--protein glycosyltransferase
VATPFSLAPWHVAGNARASEVLAAHDDERAYRAALATGARYVLATPFSTLLGQASWSDRATLARRLLEHAGMQDDQGPASAHFRWLHDSAEPGLEPGVPFARVVEVVAGAELRGRATPGAELFATLDVPTGQEPLHYRRTARAKADGTFSLRVAYPAARSLIEGPGLRAEVPVAESDVREGRAVAVPSGIGLESGRSSE